MLRLRNHSQFSLMISYPAGNDYPSSLDVHGFSDFPVRVSQLVNQPPEFGYGESIGLLGALTRVLIEAYAFALRRQTLAGIDVGESPLQCQPWQRVLFAFLAVPGSDSVALLKPYSSDRF